jgi:hypothetical protein
MIWSSMSRLFGGTGYGERRSLVNVMLRVLRYPYSHIIVDRTPKANKSCYIHLGNYMLDALCRPTMKYFPMSPILELGIIGRAMLLLDNRQGQCF